MVNILDCTFRDGGYYNNWDFSEDLFQEYLDAFATTTIQFMELGFRFLEPNGFRGAHAFTTDDYLNSFRLPKEKTLAVMVNAADFLSSKDLQRDLRTVFAPAESSPISLVRIASHLVEIQLAVKIARELHNLGYQVAINLMQISEISEFELISVARAIDSEKLETFYVADSLGSLTPSRVEAIAKTLMSSTATPLGLHAHDNLGLAHENSVTAVNFGFQFIDGTIRGMGRGPGNTKTEELAFSLLNSDQNYQSALALAQLSETSWARLQSDLGWGRNIHYFLAGLKGVHPTFVQELLSDSRFSPEEALKVISRLADSESKKFDPKILKASFSAAHRIPTSLPLDSGIAVEKWEPNSFETALIIGPGQTVERRRRSIGAFLRNNEDCLVILTNGVEFESSSMTTIRAMSFPNQIESNSRFMLLRHEHIVLPGNRLSSALSTQFRARIQSVPFFMSETLNVGSKGVESPVDNVFAFAYGLAVMSGVSNIFVAGFDGIGKGDHRDHEMLQLLESIENSELPTVRTITPSSLPFVSVSPFVVRT